MQVLILIISIAALIVASKRSLEIKALKDENIEIKKELYKIRSELLNKKDTLYSDGSAERFVAVKQPEKNVSTKTPSVPEQHTQPVKNTNLENKIGKNAMGIVATVLIFIGVIAFGTLVFTSVTDTIKIASMFIASFIVIAAGVVFTVKSKSAFSEALTGCGMGMTYISLFISHIFYEAINDITTFVLVFVWAVAISLVSKSLKLNSLSYISLVGCIVSGLFAFFSGLAIDKSVEITVYQMLTFVLLIISNKENQRLFKLSSFSAVLLNTVLAIVFSISKTHNYEFFALCMLLAIYNTVIYVYSSNGFRLESHLCSFVSNTLRCLSLSLTFCLPVKFFITENFFKTSTDDTWYSLTFLVLVVVFVAITQFAYNFFVANKAKRVFSFVFVEVWLSLVLLVNPIHTLNGSLSSLLILVIFNLVLYKYLLANGVREADSIYRFGFWFLIAECVLSIFVMKPFVNIGAFYALALVFLVSIYVYTKHQDAFKFPYLQSLVLNVNFLIAVLRFSESNLFDVNLMLAIIVICNIFYTFYCNIFKTSINRNSFVFMESIESLLAIILMFYVAGGMLEFSNFVLALALVILALIKIKYVVDVKVPRLSVWYGIKFTFFTFMFFETFFQLSDQAFILSLFFIVSAALCVVFGFINELKSLRFYGLVLIMISVFKMVVIDVWDQNSIVRVFALIAGGVICFLISAAYSKFEKQQKTATMPESNQSN